MQRRKAALAVLLVVGPGAVIGLVVAAALHAAYASVATWYCVVLAILAVGLLRLAKVLVVDLEAPMRPVHGPALPTGTTPELLTPIERRLSAATRERRLFITGLQPTLRDLAGERVRLHQGIDLGNVIVANPDQARAALGDDLWQWLTTQDYHAMAPTAQQLQQLIAAIERL